MPEYVTTGEAAKALGFHIRTLQRAIRDGEIEPHSATPGGHPRWDVERLQLQLLELRRARRRRDG